MIDQQTTGPWTDEALGAEEILRRVAALGPVIERDAAWMAREQRLSDDVRRGLVEAGAFRIGFPAEWGGPEMRLEQQVELLERLAYHDGGVAWNVTILADAGMLASLLDRAVAEELYPTMDLPTAMTMHPIGRADRIDGGYRLSGRWAFGTGIRSCDRAVASFHKHIDGEVVVGADGQPETWMAWVPAEQIETHDTWHTTGLAGSGSTGWSVDGYEVPDRHLFSFGELFEGSGDRHRLVRHYSMFIANQTGVPLGLVGRALDELRAQLAKDATSPRGAKLKERPAVQIEVARAHGLWLAARSSALHAFADISDALWADRELTDDQIAALTSVPITSAQLCWQAMDIIMNLAGSKSILAEAPFEPIFRDMATAVRHRYFRPDHLEMAGRLLLGEPVGEEQAG